MASTQTDTELAEFCEHCGRETPHAVSLELKTESSKEQNAEFSREPYRVTTCQLCGEARSQRMNNA